MATVANLSGNYATGAPVLDRKLSSPNRAVAAVHGTATPNYVGEIVTDTTADVNYRAIGTGTSDWVVDNKVLT